MEQILNWISENLYLTVLVVGPPAAYFYFKLLRKNINVSISILFIFGLSLSAIGIVFTYVLYSTHETINAIYLNRGPIATKAILVGYCFMFFSLLYYLDQKLNNLFKK